MERGGKKRSSRSKNTLSEKRDVKSSLCVIGKQTAMMTASPAAAVSATSSQLQISASNPWISSTRVSRAEPVLGKTIIVKNPKSTRALSRYLMKKYGQRWLKKVYGRVSPTVARHHYKVHLVCKVMCGWKEVWFSECCEWKLNIRADCHNRYRLWYMVWKRWIIYVRQRKEKGILISKAHQFESRQLCGRLISQWRNVLKLRQQLVLEKSTAEEFHKLLLKRRAMKHWLKWKEQTDRQREKKVLALTHYNKCLLIKCYRLWSNCYRQVCTASSHYSITILRQSISVWRQYVQLRTRKKCDGGKALRHYTEQLLSYCFLAWKRSVYQLNQLRDARAQRNLMLLRNTFTLWKSYVHSQQLTYRLSELATAQYNRHLMSTAMRGFIDYHHQQIYHKSLVQSAIIHSDIRCLRAAWRVWLYHCEQSEDMKLHPLTKRARNHHWYRLLTHYWKKWRLFISVQTHRNTQSAVAMKHYRMTTLPMYFQALRKNVEICQYKRKLLVQSEDFRRNVLLSQLFYYWWQTSAHRYTCREQLNQAIVHYQTHLLRHSLQVWRARALTIRREIRLESLANVHCNHRILSQSLRKWRYHRLYIQSKHLIAQTHYSKHLMRHVWLNWRSYITVKRNRSSNNATAITHWSEKLCRQCMASWKKYHMICRVRNMKLELSLNHYCNGLIRYTFSQWFNNVKHIIKQRNQLTASLIYQHRSLMRRAFVQWKRKLNVCRREQAAESALVVMATEVIDRVKLRVTFDCWLQFVQSRLLERAITLRAYQFNSSKVLKQSFNCWYEYYQLQVKEKNLMEKAGYFNETRLISTAYSKWRLMFMEKLVTQHQTVLSLWHWSQRLQHTVLKIWLIYTRDKNRQKKRYIEAMEEYRTQLLLRGVTQWIEVATNIKATRCERALKQHVLSNTRVWQCVKRCALHWRMKTMERRSNETTPTKRMENRSTTPAVADAIPAVTVIEKHASSHWDSLIPSDHMSHRCRPAPRCPLYLTQTAPVHDDIQPRPSTPPIPPSPQTSLSVSADSSFHSNKPNASTCSLLTYPVPTTASSGSLKRPHQWKLLPPSAFSQINKHDKIL